MAQSEIAYPPVLGALGFQPHAQAVLAASVPRPVHAYLFLGPPGSGKGDAARAFAAALVCPAGGCGDCAACRDALGGLHPDVTTIEREGASISVEVAREVVRLAQRSPRSAARQVIVLEEMHLVEEAAPALLKTIEEPPATTVFLVVADALPPLLATIASRCVEVRFRGLRTSEIEAELLASGVAPEIARSVATSSAGRLDRARLLARDPGFASRQALWAAVLDRLDGTGATVAVLAEELLVSAGGLLQILAATQTEELAAREAHAKLNGERALPGRQLVEDRHRREQRRMRTDELRAGLAALARGCRARLGSPPSWDEVERCARRVAAIDAASRALDRNPNETLLLETLLIELELAR